jgi:chromosome segregation ATPase
MTNQENQKETTNETEVTNQLTPQEFVEQANSKEKTLGHNKFQQEIQNYQIQVSELEQRLVSKNKENEDLNNKVYFKDQEYTKFQEMSNQVKQTYENRISNLSTQYENLKRQLETKSDEYEDLKKRYNIEYPKVTDLYKDIDTLKNDLHEISINKDLLKEKFDNLTELYNNQNKKLENKNDLCDQLTNELNLQKSIVHSLEKEIEILKLENINCKNKLEDLQIYLDEKEQELVKQNTTQVQQLNINSNKNETQTNTTSAPSRRVRLYGSRRRKV